MSLSGSMMDMYLTLDHEKQDMRMRSTTVDLGSNAPSVHHSEQWPCRASLSINRTDTPIDRDRPKKGFAKIWGMVMGHRSSKIDTQCGRTSQLIDRSEDNVPLAPLLPLSYLMNRASREWAMSSVTHCTSTLIPTATMTPGSSLPTPTSIRNPWKEQDASKPTSRILMVHAEEMSNSGSQGIDMPAVYSTSPEYNMRQCNYNPTMQQMSLHIHEPSSPRPISVYPLHKSLPPLHLKI
ncbi:hypothetical protein M0805_001743 [Coniferiporia weirii]|nr:hypothetical protein M0805_001743 [Coniferiporia weirii]